MIPGEKCSQPETVEEATNIRQKILLCVRIRGTLSERGKARAWLTFVIVRGRDRRNSRGALAESPTRHEHDFRRINPSEEILLWKAGPRILTAFPRILRRERSGWFPAWE